MSRRQTDIDWEVWGKSNPYFGVLSDPKFLRPNITAEVKKEFFDSGKSHAKALFQVIYNMVGKSFKPHACLDFGCGVGRITLALADYCQAVKGIDVSSSMLKEAEANLPSKLKPKVSFSIADQEMTTGRQYDLVHSYIVLQHIPKSDGYKITQRLLEKTFPGGVAALHYTFATHVSRGERSLQLARYNFPPVHYGLNLARGKPLKEPIMHIYDYDLNKLLLIYQKFGMIDLRLEITRHGAYSGVFIIARKPVSVVEWSKLSY